MQFPDYKPCRLRCEHVRALILCLLVLSVPVCLPAFGQDGSESTPDWTALQRKGEAAIPELVRLMERDDLGYSWTSPPRALLDLGDKSLPSLIKLLKGNNKTARRRAAWALMKRNRPCKEAIVPLIDILKENNDDSASGYAAAALIPNGKDSIDAVPHLIPLAFRITHTHSFFMAVEAIGLDTKLIPRVIGQVATNDNNPEARRLRIYTGARLLAASGKDGAVVLAEALGHKNLSVRLAAAQAIQQLGEQAKTDAVVKALNTLAVDETTRVDAAAALVAIGASAETAVPGLIKDLERGRVDFLASTDLRYSCRAADVLALIPEALPAVIEGLGSDKEIVRIGCVWSLSSDKATVERAFPAILRVLAQSTSQREQ